MKRRIFPLLPCFVRGSALFGLLFGLSLLLPEPSALGAETGPQRRVLLLNSYQQRMTWVADIVRAVEEELTPDQSNIVLHIENMETKRFFGPEYLDALVATYRVKYRTLKPDLILSSDNHAFDFLLAHRDTLFPGVPMVFCGVNDFREEQIEGRKDITGVVEDFSDRETIETILHLHPQTKEIFIINDYLKTGRAWSRTIRENIARTGQRIRFTLSEDLPVAELLERIGRLEEGAVVLLGVYFSDRNGRSFTYEKLGAMLAAASRVPFYCLLEFNIGEGVVGGKVVSGHRQGKMMAALGRRILAGEDADLIPVIKRGANRFIFDHRQLQRFGIPERKLPEGSLVINRPESVYQDYKGFIWMVTGFIGLLLAVICGLVVNIRRRALAEGRLRLSEERFRQLAENIREVFWTGSSDWKRVYYISPAYETVWGRSCRSLYDAPASWMDAIVFDDRKKVAACIEGRNEEDLSEIRFPEYRIVRPDGSVRWILARGFPIGNGEGKACRVVGVARDITERRRTEEKYRELVENAQSIILRWNFDGKVLFLNEYGQKLFGFGEKEIVGKSIIGTIVPETESTGRDLAALMDRVVRNTTKHRVSENENITRDGRRLWVSWRNMPLFSGGSEHPEILSVGIDNTERKRAQDRLRRLNEELEQRVESRTQALERSIESLKQAQKQLVESEKMAALGGLVAGVAHEISTPVGIGVTSTSYIEDRTVEISALYENGSFRRSDFERYLSIVRESSAATLKNLKRAAALIANFKQVAVDQVSEEKRTFNLKVYIGEALSSLAPRYKRTGHRIDVSGEDDIVLHSYPGVFMQILTNLVVNSLLHGFEGIDAGRITIDILRAGEMVELRYADDGLGMTGEQCEKIFEPFYTTKRGQGGTGLGMHIVYNHVTRSLGGTIACSSRPKEGTAFRIRIPAGPGSKEISEG